MQELKFPSADEELLSHLVLSPGGMVAAALFFSLPSCHKTLFFIDSSLNKMIAFYWG